MYYNHYNYTLKIKVAGIEVMKRVKAYNAIVHGGRVDFFDNNNLLIASIGFSTFISLETE
jgi:hypothetical protein